MTRILLADDHEIMRSGLILLLTNSYDDAVIDQAWDGKSVLQKVKASDYDLMILDVNMPDTESFTLIDEILALRPEARMLIFSMNAEEVYAKKFLQRGALGYISKTAPASEIRTAVDSVLNNRRYLSSTLLATYTDDSPGKQHDNPFDKLSTREFQIVQHLIKGESIKTLCEIFGLQPSTVGTHKARIFEKLKCKNLVEVNHLARVHNVIP